MAARMRYAHQALEELRKMDPNTCISLNFIKALALRGKVPVHKIGNRRRLINFDALLEYLENTEDDDRAEAPSSGVRRVPEKIVFDRRV